MNIGATLGVLLASVFGLPVMLTAAWGYAAVFGSATNTLLAPILIGLEVFDPEQAVPFAIICIIAFVCNGNRTIYGKQRVSQMLDYGKKLQDSTEKYGKKLQDSTEKYGKKLQYGAKKHGKKLQSVLYIPGKMLQYYISECDRSIETLRRNGVTGNVKEGCISKTFGLENGEE